MLPGIWQVILLKGLRLPVVNTYACQNALSTQHPRGTGCGSIDFETPLRAYNPYTEAILLLGRRRGEYHLLRLRPQEGCTQKLKSQLMLANPPGLLLPIRHLSRHIPDKFPQLIV
jgi:hypothetical protein